MKDAQHRNIATLEVKLRAQILSAHKQTLSAGFGAYFQEIGDTYIYLLGDFS